MNKPFFVIAGAQRCGTTYLYNILDQHPQIEMAKPQKPEPKYFLNEEEFRKGKEYYFDRFYQANSRAEIFGEKSTSYIESKQAALRILNMFTNAKIIFVLRNPVYRAISNYYFSVKNSLEARTLHEVFIEGKPNTNKYQTSVSPFNYIERGEYIRFLEPYYNIFGDDRIKVVLFEELVESNVAIKEIFRFLEVDYDIELRGTLVKVNENPDYEIDATVSDVLYLHFSTYNRALEQLTGLDLSKWTV